MLKSFKNRGMKSSVKYLFVAVIALFSCNTSFATVKYDGNTFVIDGILLLQDADDTLAYYYAPKFPTLAMKPDSSVEFLFMKYSGVDEQSSGGLFHALIEFTVSDDLIASVLKKLRKKIPRARLKGRLPFLPSNGNTGDFSGPTFEIISSVLSSGGDGGFTRSIVASGNAPMTPGSKAAVAAMLDSRGATLLWKSLSSGPTSDLSVGVKAYYEAMLPAYNAVITVDMQKVYSEFNEQTKTKRFFSQKDINNKIDSFAKNGGISIDIVDRSQAFDIDNSQMSSLVDMISEKVTDLMFGGAEGFIIPDPEPEVETTAPAMDPMMMMMMMGSMPPTAQAGVIGFMALNTVLDKVLDNNKDIYSLKNKKEVNLTKYKVNLSKRATVKVPFYTAGNLSLFYNSNKDVDSYFKIVNMDDADFQRKEVAFQIDADYVDTFDDLLNFVTIKFKKTYSNGQEEVVEQLMFNKKDLDNGVNLKSVFFPRLGLTGKNWQEYQYQIVWSLKGKDVSIRIPEKETEWIKSSDPVISLKPPFERVQISVDAERDRFINEGFASAQIRFASIIGGKPTQVKRLLLRSNDPEWSSSVSIFKDIDKPIVFETSWYSGAGEIKQDLKLMESGYMFVVPPHQENNIDAFRKDNPLPPKQETPVQETAPEQQQQEGTEQQEEGTEQQEEGTEQQEEGTEQQEEGTEQQEEGTEQQGEGTEQQEEGTEQQGEGTEQQEEGTEQQEEGTEQQEEGTEQQEEGTEQQEEGTEQQEENNSEDNNQTKPPKH
jgi:hypothetical protein